MKTDNTPHIGIGAVAGTLSGSVAGLMVGRDRAKTILGDFGSYKGLNKDEYVTFKTALATDRLKQAGIKDSWVAKNIGKVSLKAEQDYPAIQVKLKGLTKQANKAKLGWLLGIAIAGTAIGSAIGLLRKNEKIEED